MKKSILKKLIHEVYYDILHEEENKSSDGEKILRKNFKICKDVQSLRKSGVSAEKIAGEFRSFVGVKGKSFENIYTYKGTNDYELRMGFYERIISTPDKQYGLYVAGAKYGIPTLKICTNSSSNWDEIKQHMKEKGLFR